MEQLIKKYEEIVNAIAQTFINKYHGEKDEPILTINGRDIYWAGDDVGGVLCYGDMFYYNFTDMLTDLKENAPKGELDRYNEYAERCSDCGLTANVNYRNWLHGAPRYSEETLSHIEKAKQEIQQHIKDASTKENTDF